MASVHTRTKRPTTVKVGPYLYKIHYSDAKVDAFVVEDGDASAENAAAYSDTNNHVIALRTKKYSEDAIRTTLLHELLHCAFDAAGGWYKLPEDKGAEEAIIQAMSPSLLNILRENPEVTVYLTGGQ